MPIIIDTCVLLWMVGDPKNLSKNALRLIQENQAGLYVSAIAAFEISINVPHADPCDRIIIASAISRGLHIVSPDHLIQKCPDVQVSW